MWWRLVVELDVSWFGGIIMMHRVVGCCARAKGKVFDASCSHAEVFSLLYVTAFRVAAPTSVATSSDESAVKGTVVVALTHSFISLSPKAIYVNVT